MALIVYFWREGRDVGEGRETWIGWGVEIFKRTGEGAV